MNDTIGVGSIGSGWKGRCVVSVAAKTQPKIATATTAVRPTRSAIVPRRARTTSASTPTRRLSTAQPANGRMATVAQMVKRSRVKMSKAPPSSARGIGVVPPVPSRVSRPIDAASGQLRPHTARRNANGAIRAMPIHGTNQKTRPAAVSSRKSLRLAWGIGTCRMGSECDHSQYGSTTVTRTPIIDAPRTARRPSAGSVRRSRRETWGRSSEGRTLVTCPVGSSSTGVPHRSSRARTAVGPVKKTLPNSVVTW